MRLTNKQTQIVVDEIFDKVSRPIIEKNNELIENVQLPLDQYMLDCDEVEKIEAKMNKLRKEVDTLKDKYYKKKFNGYQFDYSPMGYEKSYIKFQKEKLAKVKPYLSEKEIEKQVILAGNRDIPTLIEELIIKLSK